MLCRWMETSGVGKHTVMYPGTYGSLESKISPMFGLKISGWPPWTWIIQKELKTIWDLKEYLRCDMCGLKSGVWTVLRTIPNFYNQIKLKSINLDMIFWKSVEMTLKMFNTKFLLAWWKDGSKRKLEFIESKLILIKIYKIPFIFISSNSKIVNYNITYNPSMLNNFYLILKSWLCF